MRAMASPLWRARGVIAVAIVFLRIRKLTLALYSSIHHLKFDQYVMMLSH